MDCLGSALDPRRSLCRAGRGAGVTNQEPDPNICVYPRPRRPQGGAAHEEERETPEAQDGEAGETRQLRAVLPLKRARRRPRGSADPRGLFLERAAGQTFLSRLPAGQNTGSAERLRYENPLVDWRPVSHLARCGVQTFRGPEPTYV